MQSVQVSGEVRENLGKKFSKTVRRDGIVPAVLYGAGDPVHFTVKPLDVRHLVYSPEFKLAEITLNGTTYSAIVKDYQFHPVTDALMHIDFLALQKGHPVKVEVPVTFEGTSPGVRGGGKLLVSVRRVKIKTTPEHLVDQVVLNIGKLQLGQAIRVRDIAPMEGVEIMNPGGTPIATVEVPRALRSAATAARKEAEKAAKGGAAVAVADDAGDEEAGDDAE
ncbi:50S ribosomal protein L25 [Neolewinella lacunae]|uniref:Large ribosomal subunit protein bL25 n=1 Tax=Neolewinella lacunae TaxID=1517758 RepID=A0A923PRX5_9BACT|nr:50S ribosomal protein L25 [Neolewinella lacunae]MBC6996379.1 50S ribosomal protein L25 [Neolewinella lacunae]MDN3633678.1 50S ribosomal protein L25 [Neolewinella lacunae]